MMTSRRAFFLSSLAAFLPRWVRPKPKPMFPVCYAGHPEILMTIVEKREVFADSLGPNPRMEVFTTTYFCVSTRVREAIAEYDRRKAAGEIKTVKGLKVHCEARIFG